MPDSELDFPVFALCAPAASQRLKSAPAGRRHDTAPCPALSCCSGFPQAAGAALSPVREGVEGGVEDLAQEGLRLHNEYRRQHGVAALRLSPQLCEYAREWARTLAREDRFAHRPDGRYGENIFCAWSPDSGAGPSKVGAKEACDTWYKEIKDHPFGQEPRLLKSGE